MRGQAIFLGIVLLGCGGRSVQSPQDGGPSDAAADHRPYVPPCVQSVRPGETPPDLAACGVCVEDFARVANPGGVDISDYASMAAVPGGVLVADAYYGPHAFFVTTDGQNVPLVEAAVDPNPLPPSGWSMGQPRLAPVPDSNEVWIVTTYFEPPLLDDGDGVIDRRTDYVLYQFGSDGWERLAATHLDGSGGPNVALPTGELIAPLVYVEALARIRVMGDGSVDVLQRSLSDLLAPNSDRLRAFINTIWTLPNGDIQVLDTDLINGAIGEGAESWLRILDSELQPVNDWQIIGARVDDSAYVPGVNPYVALGSIDVVNFPSGRAFLLAQGTLAGTGAASWQHKFGTWVSADGVAEQAPPGVLVNPDNYLLASEVTRTERAGFPVGLPGDRAGVIWDDFAAGGDGPTWGQVVASDGSLVLPSPVSFGNDGIDARFISIGWTQDGAGNAYLRRVEDLHPGANDLRSIYSVQRVGPDLQYVWPDWVYPQQCADRVNEYSIAVEGAYDEGVWVLWMDVMPDNDGTTWVGKIALLRPDGTWAW